MEHTNALFRDIGEQHKTYLTLNVNGICSIISARILKSSKLHMKKLSLSNSDKTIKISWKKRNMHQIYYKF